MTNWSSVELNELIPVSDSSLVDIDHGLWWRGGKGIICIRVFKGWSEKDLDFRIERLGSTMAVGRDGTRKYSGNFNLEKKKEIKMN